MKTIQLAKYYKTELYHMCVGVRTFFGNIHYTRSRIKLGISKNNMEICIRSLGLYSARDSSMKLAIYVYIQIQTRVGTSGGQGRSSS